MDAIVIMQTYEFLPLTFTFLVRASVCVCVCVCVWYLYSQDEDAALVRDGEEDPFLIQQSSQDFLEVRKAEYIGYNRRVQRDSELLFTPSVRTGTSDHTHTHTHTQLTPRLLT